MTLPKIHTTIIPERTSVPVIYQSEMAECGLACLAMISSYYGHVYDLVSLRNKFSISLTGANLKNIIDIAEQLCLSSRPIKVKLEQLAGLRTPAILHWDLNHFVVLEKITKKYAVIIDPAKGRLKLNADEVSAHYTGIALELTPTEDFTVASEVESVRFSDLWSRILGLKRSLTFILIATLIVSFFSILSPQYIQSVVDDAILGRDENLLIILAFGFGLILLFEVSVRALRSFLVLVMSNSMHIQIADNLFRRLINLPLEYYEKRHIGDIVSRFGSIEQLREIFTTTFVEAIVDGIFIVITLVILFVYSPMLAIVAIVASILYGALRFLLFYPMRSLTEESIREKANEQSVFMESVRGVQTIKIFGKETLRRTIWQNNMVSVTNKNMMLGRYLIVFQVANGLIFGLENILTIYLGAHLVLDSKFTVGMLYAFIAYKGFFINSSSALIEKYFEFLMAKIHLIRISDIVRSPLEDTTNGRWVVDQAAPATLELQDVAYRYSSGSDFLFKNVNIKISSGEAVAIVGPSGVGKTTLLKVMAGLLQPTTGRIFYCGKDIYAEGIKQYRQRIAAVMQEDDLFAGSVFDNICFFDAHPDRDFVEECSKHACIHGDIAKMPMGYNTLVGDMGSTLSGGQKQRLLLARALYHKPSLIFLDEATSHLDAHNESLINMALRNLDCIRITIAHRPSTIRHSDRFFTIVNQTVIEIDKDQALSLSEFMNDVSPDKRQEFPTE